MKKLVLVIAALSCFYGCTNKERQNAAAQRVKQATLDSINYANAQQRKIDSLEALTRSATTNATLQQMDGPAMTPIGAPRKPQTRKVKTTHPAPAVNTAAVPNTNPSPSSPANNSTVAATPGTNTTANTPEKKKGLNNAAKGAIIGLGTGAAAGAIIGKENRGKGAVIGGVIGAIGGAVGGAVIDKNKQKKEAKKDTVK
jgi:hypothetical protein